MTREIRILHTADTHLGYRQYHSDVRRQDFFKAFEAVVKDAIDMQVDAVVHAGDFFDSRTPSLEDVLEAISIISPLRAAKIPLLGIVGNHESKQNMQWLDLFEEMGLARRLGKKPYILGEVAIYGIDSVPKSKIPAYDYSGFEVPAGDSGAENEVEAGKETGQETGQETEQKTGQEIGQEKGPEKRLNLVVMHQLMNPFPYGEWDCEEVIEKLPFRTDAILLGDYHKYEKIKVGGAWVTYPGSTERNSASEREPRSYNIITFGDPYGLEISRRNLETRKFLFIRADLKEEERPYEQVFSAVDEYEEELEGAVVFVEISGDVEAALSFSEIEEYILSKGALVPRIKDLREIEALPPEEVRVSFSDPDRAVAEEIKRMALTDGGLIIDEIVRSPLVSKTNVDSETENRLQGLVEKLDFGSSDFRIESGISENSGTAEPEIQETPDTDADTGTEQEGEEAERPAFSEEGGGEEREGISPEAFLAGQAADLLKKAQSENPAAGKEAEAADKKKEAEQGEAEQGKSKPETEKSEQEQEQEQEKTGQEPERKETVKKGKKAGAPAPRQYNLGDYL